MAGRTAGGGGGGGGGGSERRAVGMAGVDEAKDREELGATMGETPDEERPAAANWGSRQKP